MSGDALAYLRARQRAGRIRYLLRRMRTARGVLGALATVSFLLLVLGGRLVQLWRGASPAPLDEVVRYGATGAALMAVVGVAASRGLAFSPAEVEFLFAGPFTARAVVRHFLVSRLRVQALAALWVGLYLMPFATLPLAALAAAGCWFAFVFCCSVGAAQARAWLEGVLPDRTRTAVAWLLGAGAAVEMARAGWAAWRAGNAATVLDAPLLRLLRVPVLPFAHLFAAPSAGPALAWGAACAALTAGAAALVLGADVDLRERSLAATARLQRRRNRRRGTAGGGDAVDEPVVRDRPARPAPVPELRWLGRAAPLARRHLAELWRDRGRMAGVLVYSLLMNALIVGAPALLVAGGPDGEREGMSLLPLGLLLLVPVLTSGGVALDFRRDLDRMALLRALPLRPLAVAVGQVASPAMVIAGIQALCTVAVAALMPGVPPLYAAGALLVLPPLAWTVVAVDNLVFLLLPVRPVVPGTPRAVFPARNYLLAIVKMAVLALALGFAGACAFVLCVAARQWMPAGVAGGVAGLVLSAAGATWAVAWAFTRFDVSRDIPA